MTSNSRNKHKNIGRKGVEGREGGRGKERGSSHTAQTTMERLTQTLEEPGKSPLGAASLVTSGIPLDSTPWHHHTEQQAQQPMSHNTAGTVRLTVLSQTQVTWVLLPSMVVYGDVLMEIGKGSRLKGRQWRSNRFEPVLMGPESKHARTQELFLSGWQ